MTSRKVIVFGPTGAVGSATALTAEELGAKVVLAMRSIEKPIPGLDSAKEKQGNFERVHADLTKSDTVHDAVSSTGAKHAFMYCAHGTADHMKSTIEALKSAGIQTVVFLSSFTVRGDLAAIQPADLIAYMHGQVEINLRATFGEKNVIAVRAGSFASNTLQFKPGFEKGVVKLYMPDARLDCIAPEDIGRVSGTVLAKGPQDEERCIYLYGPKLLAQRDAIGILAKTLGKSPRIEGIVDEQEAYDMFVQELGRPPPVAKYLVAEMGKQIGQDNQVFGCRIEDEQFSNVEKYSGKKGMTFEEWAEKNRHLFVS